MSNWGFGLGLLGMALGFYFGGPAGAQIGWAVGSGVSAFLGLDTTDSYSQAQRLTDFKAFNSKYGNPIPRGYGNVRLPGNMIWSGPVREVEQVQASCAQTPGAFLGLSINKSCNYHTTFHYYQSAAIAFAEGPACAMPRIWADGQVVKDTRTANAPGIASITHRRADINPCRPETVSPFRIYLGTPTQPVDTTIKQWLGPEMSESGLDEATAFRNTVYVMITELDLEPYGYRLPVLSAEVSFGECTPPVFTYLDQSELDSERYAGNRKGWDVGGLVRRRPNIGWGVSRWTGVRTMWNFFTGRVMFQDLYTRDIPWGMFSANMGNGDMGPNYEMPDSYFPFGNRFFISSSNFITGAQSAIVGFDLPIAWWGRLSTHIYDEIRGGFWCIFGFGGGIVFFPSANPPQEGLLEIETIETLETAAFEEYIKTTFGFSDHILDGTTGFASVLGNKYLAVVGTFGDEEQLSISGYEVFEGDTRGDGGANIYTDKEGNIWWHTNSRWTLKSFINFVQATEIQIDYRGSVTLCDSLGVPLFGGSTSAYCPTTDCIYVLALGHLIKVPRLHIQEALLTANLGGFGDEVFYNLPDVTDVDPIYGTPLAIPYGSTDYGQWSNGINDGILYGTESLYGGKPRFIHLDSMTPVDSRREDNLFSFQIFPDGGHDGFNSTSAYVPHMDMLWNRSLLCTWWRGEAEPWLLSDIVTDLMTQSDRDPRARLTPADIDVSELTDLVKGFHLLSQTPIRGYMTVLQQTYQFDAVESDGKIKFLKRARPITFQIDEDSMAAHSYDSSRDERVQPLNHERQSEVELPNEVLINYTSFEDELLQGTQRARRQTRDSATNETLVLPVVLNKDEAAQVADIILSEAWVTRSAPFNCFLGPEFLTIDPTDVIQVNMRDGTTYKLRVTRSTIGANGINQLEAALEFSSIYTSNAVGVGNLVLPKGIPSPDLEPIMYDLTARCLRLPESDNQAGFIAGVGAMDDGILDITALQDETFLYNSLCVGGRFYVYNFEDGVQTTSLVAAAGEENCVCWGTCARLVGHTSAYNVTNVRDDENSIQITIFGGNVPLSQTDEIALGEGGQFLIIGNEIIGFTTVTRDFSEGIIGNDIWVDVSGGTFDRRLRSTTTDFTQVIKDDEVFMLRASNTQQPYRGIAHLAKTVTPNEVIMGDYHFLDQSLQVGTQVLINSGPFNTITLTGLYRGLFGTDVNRFHPEGEYVAFTQNLDFGPLEFPPLLGDPLTGFVMPSSTALNTRTTKTVHYGAGNLKPWPVTNVQGTGGGISWERQDKVYSDGIIPMVPTDTSETIQSFEVMVINGIEPAHETDIIDYKKVGETSFESNFRVRIFNSGSVFGESRVRVVQIHQLPEDYEAIGRGFQYQDIVSLDNEYLFVETPLQFYPEFLWSKISRVVTCVECNAEGTACEVTAKVDGFVPYFDRCGSAFDSLLISAGNGSKYRMRGIIRKECSPSVHSEVVGLVQAEFNQGSQFDNHGVFLRGADKEYLEDPIDSYLESIVGDKSITAITAGLGGFGRDRFVISHWANGQQSPLAILPFKWFSNMNTHGEFYLNEEDTNANSTLVSSTPSFGSTTAAVGHVYAIKLRVFGNRVQAKVWQVALAELGGSGNYYDDKTILSGVVDVPTADGVVQYIPPEILAGEPVEWMVDAYFNDVGPFYGSTGFFSRGTMYCGNLWVAHRGLTVSADTVPSGYIENFTFLTRPYIGVDPLLTLAELNALFDEAAANPAISVVTPEYYSYWAYAINNEIPPQPATLWTLAEIAELRADAFVFDDIAASYYWGVVLNQQTYWSSYAPVTSTVRYTTELAADFDAGVTFSDPYAESFWALVYNGARVNDPNSPVDNANTFDPWTDIFGSTGERPTRAVLDAYIATGVYIEGTTLIALYNTVVISDYEAGLVYG